MSTPRRPGALLATLLALGGGACSHGEASQPWTESSMRLRIEAFSAEQGASAVDMPRTELTEPELRGLAGLRLVPAEGTCSADALAYAVTITDVSGLSRSYESVAGNHSCGGRAKVLSVEPIASLLQARRCISSGQTEGGASASNAPLVAPSNECRHGLKSSSDGTTTWLRLAVTEPGRTHVLATELGTAAVDTELTLFPPGTDPDHAKPMATARANTSDAGTGAVLARTLERAGEYPLRLRARGQDGLIYVRFTTTAEAGDARAGG